MQALKSYATQRAGCLFLSALLAFPTFALAQDPPAPPPAPTSNDIRPDPATPPSPAPTPATGGWKRVGDQSAQNQPPQNPANSDQQAPPPAAAPDGSVQAPPPPASPQANGNGHPQPPPPYAQQQPYGQPNNGYPAYGQQGGYPPPQGYPQQGYPQQGYPQPNYQQQQPVPASLSVPAGTYITVRINQLLSSDRNQVGDAFSATLLKPLVVNGVVVAEPGQTIGGHVAEAVKAGRVSGVARLGVQLTDLALVDGQQIPIKSSLVSRTGPSSTGQDAGSIVGTTALGAAVGAAVGWGRGAAIGAGSGALLGIVGVLVTRGHPSVLYPEQILTFRIESAFVIDTTHAPQAFRYIEPGEYGQQPPSYGPYTQSNPYPPAAAPAPYYYGYGYPYSYPYYAYGYPYYWGPGFSLFLGGRGYYGGRYYYGGRPYVGGLGVRSYGGVVGGRVGGGSVGARSLGSAGGGARGGGGHR